MMREQDYSTPRVSRHRRHEDGDHGECLPGNCKQATQLEYRDEERLFAVALFEALAGNGINAEAFFGDGYGEARESADAELPDYSYLPREPDSLVRLRAKRAINS
jgi:hypothetical protein